MREQNQLNSLDIVGKEWEKEAKLKSKENMQMKNTSN